MKYKFFITFIFIFFILVSFSKIINADVISLNSGGSENIIINPDKYLEGFFSGEIPLEEPEEEPTPEPTPTPSVGGGGAVISQEFEDLITVPESFNIPAIVGINTFAQIFLSNIGESELNINIGLINLDSIVKFDETSLILGPGQSEILEFIIISPEEPGIYTGKITFISGNKKLEIPFALNVNSRLSLFDLSLDISEDFKIINVGEELVSQITLIQAGLQENVDVVMRYLIKDFEGKVYSEETETIAVFREKSYEHEFDTQKLSSGDYLAGAEVIYSGGVATGSSQFKVISLQERGLNLIIIIELIVAIFILIILILIAKNYKQKKYKRKS